MIIKESDINVIKRITTQCKISQQEFSDIAHISERTFRSALKGKNISNKTWNKIYNTVICIKLKYEITKLENDLAEKHNREKNKALSIYNCVLNYSLLCIAVLGIFLLLNWLLK